MLISYHRFEWYEINIRPLGKRGIGGPLCNAIALKMTSYSVSDRPDFDPSAGGYQSSDTTTSIITVTAVSVTAFAMRGAQPLLPIRDSPEVTATDGRLSSVNRSRAMHRRHEL
jgi:hypothetical protein